MKYLMLTTALIYCCCLLIAFFILLCILMLIFSKPYADIKRYNEEKYFKNPHTNKNVLFPSLLDQPSIHLSVIVPAYNEEERLPPMLKECIEFLENRSKTSNFEYEIIIVSDGSRDKTVEKANSYSDKYGSDKIRVLELVKNRGKGGAVRLGVLSARGALILFADADGATKFSDLTKLESAMDKMCAGNYLENKEIVSNKMAIGIGSRAHLEDDAIASRSFFRTILMYGFHFLVWTFAVRGIRDTQCGFKLLTRAAAKVCFYNIHVEKWAFDVELLYIAQRLQIKLSEVSVNWTEIDGSKITPLLSWIQMGMDISIIFLKYRIGAWKIRINTD